MCDLHAYVFEGWGVGGGGDRGPEVKLILSLTRNFLHTLVS